ncbi:hypothetical protein ACHWQZ_G011049 [Mnemiopsis leidyi]
MLLRSLARQYVVGGQTLLCTRHRHPDTKPSDETIEIRPDQKLVNFPLLKHSGRPTSVTIVHDRPQVTSGLDTKQPRRDNLLRPRWPEEFIVEPVQTARYGIVALETGALGFKAVKASKEFITTNIERGKHRLFVRYFPDYPISLRPSNTRRGGGKNKVAEYRDYVMAGRVLFEFDCSPVVATIIYDGVFKRMPLATMLVEGDKHRNPAKVIDVGKRDRLGLKIYNYKIEHADGTTSDFKVPKRMYKDQVMRKCVMENMQLDYSHWKHKSFGNDRLREKSGTAH